MSKQLTELEFERMEKFRLLQTLREKEKEILQLKSARLKDQATILEMKAGLEAQKLRDEMQKVDTNLAKERREKDALMAAIRERLDIKGKFGFDPDTLEVVTDEDVEERALKKRLPEDEAPKEEPVTNPAALPSGQ